MLWRQQFFFSKNLQSSQVTNQDLLEEGVEADCELIEVDNFAKGGAVEFSTKTVVQYQRILVLAKARTVCNAVCHH